MSEPFVLGCNYWPRTKAMYWWGHFDAGEVREEFALMREIGLNVVRFFLLWDDFQPTPDAVSPACMANLVTVCDIAAENGLGIDLTFFTGHMSGPNWSPRWLLDPTSGVPSRFQRQVVSRERIVAGGYRNPYIDPVALAAERLLIDTVVGALKSHPAIWMWNLGNEPDLFAWPPDDATGRAWVREMTARIKAIDPARPVTCGLHSANLLENNHLRVDQVFRETDVATMHIYPMYLDWSRHPLDPDVVPFACALTSALCGKPALMEEFGGCTVGPGQPSQVWEWVAYGHPRAQFMASEEALAEYLAAVLPKLVDVGSTGALVWCWADYVQALWDRPPCDDSRHERFFGLVRPDGSLKPHAQVIRDFAATKPHVNPNPPRRVQLDISSDTFYSAPAEQAVRLYQQYLKEYAL